MKNPITPTPFDQLKCSDNFMFAKIMEDPEICKEVLETLLDIKIASLSYPEPEKTIQASPDAKAIRLDVHTADTDKDFDIEIQTTLYKELRQRSRYYQSLMDVDYLQKGHMYSELKQNYVIFICLQDLFGKGLPVYTFENTCNENTDLKLEDKTYKVFYNCSKWKEIKKQDKSELLKFFLTDKAVSSRPDGRYTGIPTSIVILIFSYSIYNLVSKSVSFSLHLIFGELSYFLPFLCLEIPFFDYFCRITNSYRVGRNVFRNYTSCSYYTIISNFHIS